MFEVDFKILNQKSTPAIYADTLALRPSPGFVGRLFVATDLPYGVFRDTGTAWVQVASNGGGGGSTGVNGLNGTTNIGLGGTLTDTFTTINGNSKTLNIFNTTAFILTSTNSGISSGIFGVTDYVSLQSSNNSGIYSFYKTKINNQFTVFSGSAFGLSLDNTTGKFVIGDYGNARKYNSFVVNDDTNQFYLTTSFNQVNNNQDLFFASNASAGTRFVKLGDFNGYAGNNYLIVDDANGIIRTNTLSGSNGFYISNEDQLFGNLYGSLTYLAVNSTNEIIQTYNNTASKGLFLDFGNEIYSFGDNNAKAIFDNTNQYIELQTTNLIFTGAALESGSSGGNSGQHLVITLNGTQYKIKLENP
jgi:hypothetical protein